jgi:hypothetical protein
MNVPSMQSAYAGDVSEPAPELDAEDALRGVINQLTIRGQKMPVIVPGSVLETLRFVSELVKRAQGAGYLPGLMHQAMPWTRAFGADELDRLATDIADAAGSGDHAAERLSAVIREWQETADILSDPDELRHIQSAREEIARGDVVRGTEAVAALRPRA